MTTRRDFLAGLFGVAVAGAIPSALDLPVTEAWKLALGKIFDEYIQEFMLYGTAGLRYSVEEPYVELIRAKDMLLIPELYRSSGEY